MGEWWYEQNKEAMYQRQEAFKKDELKEETDDAQYKVAGRNVTCCSYNGYFLSYLGLEDKESKFVIIGKVLLVST